MRASMLLLGALAVSFAATRQLNLAENPETDEGDVSRTVARRMALGAAHNSLLSRVSLRPIPGAAGTAGMKFGNTVIPPKGGKF